jgi:hypothetical protein
MKIVIATAILFVSGCATTQVVVPECDKVGLFARSVAVVRDIGVKESEFDSYVVGIQAQTFPVGTIRNLVYRETYSPVDTYTVFYNKCVNVGYSNMLLELKAEEQSMRNERERTQRAAMLREETQRYIPPPLPLKVVEPEPKAKPEHVYGAPITDPIIHP